ncbi:Fibronectin type III domain protein [Xanthobacter versatilis]|uniref:Fibronectin type III domain protein n=1 Tax=Xanthobacter autotrophicus (strain ATCC BAA-1158 / Py2) TaxID=78245 RepID=A7IDN7_XANP2|nr:Fibronectin type III domain protein [Xanthobacter autotrophicus Py2]
MATRTITWAWGAQEVVSFDPATDVLDFGWLNASDFTITEVNGSVVIALPANAHSYTLEGVSLSDLSLANISAFDASVFAQWSAAIAADGATTPVAGTLFALSAARDTDTVLSFNPAADKLDFSGLSASDFSIAEVNGSVVIYLSAERQTYILDGVTLSQLSLSSIASQDAAVLAEWSQALASPAGSSAAPTSGGGEAVTTTLGWNWNTQTVLAFDPARDKIDFGWLTPQDFSVVELNGSVVILMPGAQQSYTLEGVTLAELSAANITARSAVVLEEWATLLSGASGSGGGSGGGSGSTLPVIEASAWIDAKAYVAGDLVSVGHLVYQANWWTLGTDPTSDHGAVGTGHVWSVVGYADLTPVAPDAPDGLHLLTTTETSATLTWDAAEVSGVGTVTGYAIYRDGELVGTTTDLSFKVSGLVADTTYHFSVVAVDEAGTSPAATPIAVTTDAPGTDAADQQHFSPYFEMWLPSSQNLVQTVEDVGLTAVTLAFVLGTGPDQIGWGGLGSIDNDTLANGTTISSMVAALQQNGVEVTISFGGGYGQEPALSFTNVAQLTAAYQSVMDKYNVTSLDFDIEADALTNTAASHLRNEALVALEQANPDLTVSFTLPALPTGLNQAGLDLLAQAKADGVEIDTVNIMVMNYGAYYDSGDMGKDAIDAAEATIAQLHQLGLDAKVAITPMIGQNDVPGEVFTLDDARQLLDYAEGNDHIAYIAMWSLGRDHGDDVGHLTETSSGVAQHDYDFAKIFSMV